MQSSRNSFDPFRVLAKRNFHAPVGRSQCDLSGPLGRRDLESLAERRGLISGFFLTSGPFTAASPRELFAPYRFDATVGDLAFPCLSTPEDSALRLSCARIC
jgi:hypothetical protein